MTIQMKATGYYFPAMLYKMVLTFEPLDESLKCDHSLAGTVLSYGAAYAVQTFQTNVGSV